MIVVMKRRAGAGQVAAVVRRIGSLGFRAHRSRGTETTIIGVVGDERRLDAS